MTDRINPIAELRALEARKVASAEALKRETEEANLRIQALYDLQAPVYKATDAHRQKREAIRRVERMIELFTADAAAKRENLHAETCLRDPLNYRHVILHAHGEILHLEAAIEHCKTTIARLQTEAEALKAGAKDYAKQNDLESLLVHFDGPLD